MAFSLGVAQDMEQRWIEEVRYLHALWRQGPPRKPNQSLLPQTSSPFKSEKSAKRKAENGDREKEKAHQEPQVGPSQQTKSPVSDYEWPCNPPRPSDVEDPLAHAWDRPNASTNPSATRPLTNEELARLSAAQIQKEAAQSCRDFFEEEEDDEEDMECDEEEEEEEDEEDSFEFFMELFERGEELKAYYQMNWVRGEFVCLVCAGSEAKIGKKYANCVALVQHSLAILKTKRKAAHRAFGRAVCQVLGWDIHQLPSINQPTDKEPDVREEAASH